MITKSGIRETEINPKRADDKVPARYDEDSSSKLTDLVTLTNDIKPGQSPVDDTPKPAQNTLRVVELPKAVCEVKTDESDVVHATRASNTLSTPVPKASSTASNLSSQATSSSKNMMEQIDSLMRVGMTVEAYKLFQRAQGELDADLFKKEYSARPNLKMIGKNYKSLMQHHKMLMTHEGWTCQVDNYNDISVFYKEEAGREVHSFKIDFTLTSPILNLVAILNEVDLLPQTLSNFITTSKCIKDVESIHKWIHVAISLIWPLSPRDAVAEVLAHDCFDSLGMMVFLVTKDARTLIKEQAQSQGQTIQIPPANGASRLIIHRGAGAIIPIEENRVRVVAVFSVEDTGFGANIPPTIINFVTRQIAYYACEMFKTTAEDMQHKELNRRLRRKEIYKVWGARMEAVLQKKRTKQMSPTEEKQMEEKTGGGSESVS